jgi:antitoxin ParD1/3/4
MVGGPAAKYDKVLRRRCCGDKSMPQLQIVLSDDNQAFVSEQVAAGQFAGPSDYIATLLETARKKAIRERVDALLIEGLDSGTPIEVTPEYWRKKKEELARKYGRADKP